MTLITQSPEETRRLGRALAGQLQPGDVLALTGDMGAGKSELARGVARGLGVQGYLPSPTFTIMQLYEDGRLPLYHFDWYRLGGPEELYELSMDEYLYGEGVCLIEWPSQAWEAVPERHLDIRLRPVSQNQREIVLRPAGGFRAVDLSEFTEVKS